MNKIYRFRHIIAFGVCLVIVLVGVIVPNYMTTALRAAAAWCLLVVLAFALILVLRKL